MTDAPPQLPSLIAELLLPAAEQLDRDAARAMPVGVVASPAAHGTKRPLEAGHPLPNAKRHEDAFVQHPPVALGAAYAAPSTVPATTALVPNPYHYYQPPPHATHAGTGWEGQQHMTPPGYYHHHPAAADAYALMACAPALVPAGASIRYAPQIEPVDSYLAKRVRPVGGCDKCEVSRGPDATVRERFCTDGGMGRARDVSRKRACQLRAHAISSAIDGVALLEQYEAECGVKLTNKKQKFEAFMRNGLDVGLLNGILPETIMVGIPQDGDPLSFLPPFLHSSFPPFLPSFLPLPSFLSSCIHSPFPSSFLLEGRIASGSTN